MVMRLIRTKPEPNFTVNKIINLLQDCTARTAWDN